MVTATIDTSTAAGAHAAERLRDDIIAWLTTVRPSGQPDTAPVWFLWDGEQIIVYSRPNTAKVRNVAANPRVSLVIDDTRGGGDVIRVEGTAAIAEQHPPATDIPEYLAKYRDGIARIGMDPSSFARDYSVMMHITPTKIHY